jgi:hypothetical protein
MDKEFEYEGIWWLPDQPKKQVSGTLKFTPGKGGTLELIGSFKDIKDGSTLSAPEIILGTSANGRNITLHRCIETKLIQNVPGLPVSVFHVHEIFVGAHFQKTEDIKFKSLSVHFSLLDEWVNISGIDIQLKPKAADILIKYKYPDPIEATVKHDCKISIYTQTTFPSLSIVQSEAAIKERRYIKIAYPEEKSIDEYLRLMFHIRNFLSLGTMRPAYPLNIEAETEKSKMMINGKPYYPAVKIFYTLLDIPKVSDKLMLFNMLFTFKDISDKFEAFLNNWLEKAELLEPVYNLYFGTLYNPRMYLNQNFMSLVQAAESYHRRMMNNQELPEKEHGKRLEEVFSAVPEKHKEWLEEELAYSNEPNLRKRIREIWDKFPVVPDNLIGDKKSFISKVVTTRNYLTHYDPRLKGEAATGEKLYKLTQQVKALIEMCLLTELGFSPDNVREIFARNTWYRYQIESYKEFKKGKTTPKGG